MAALAARHWIPVQCDEYAQAQARMTSSRSSKAVLAEIERAIALNRAIHDAECINLNPATNVMNPKAEAALASGLGSRPRLAIPATSTKWGWKGSRRSRSSLPNWRPRYSGPDTRKFACLGCDCQSLRVHGGEPKPETCIIAPPPSIGGHVTHHLAGCAGMYGMTIHAAPVDSDGLHRRRGRPSLLARQVKPKMITIGSSLNLLPHPDPGDPDDRGRSRCAVLFDAAHLCGMIAGHAWPQPLEEGAHLMTMCTYKSLGGPPSGLIVTNDAEIAQKLDKIAFPGMTANFDAAKSAALAITLLDWRLHGRAYAAAMAETATALAEALPERGLPVLQGQAIHDVAPVRDGGARFGGGQAAAKKLRRANSSCGIGLPIASVEGDMNGLRMGTPEIVRWGMTADDMPELAALIARGLRDNESAKRSLAT